MSSGTIKNAHSPAGMHYYDGRARYALLTDCPACKYGTLDSRRDKDEVLVGMRCADCKREFTVDELVKLGVIRKP
jgi:hypothetical protein